MSTVGVISYQSRHLKTEQIVLKLAESRQFSQIYVLAQTFKDRPQRNALFQHRPDQSSGVPTRDLEAIPSVIYVPWNDDVAPPSGIDIFAVGGSGLLDVAFAQGRPVYNVHPGEIPTVRGLDAFKWAILDDFRLANTLHLIDHEADLGTILKVSETVVFPTDSIHSLASRHYMSEVDLLVQALTGKLPRTKQETTGPKREPYRRMPRRLEGLMLERFPEWKSTFALAKREGVDPI